MEKLLTAHELAEALNLSVETIWRYTRQKRLPVIELGKKQYRYKKEEVLAALSAEGIQVKEKRAIYAKQGEFSYEDYLRIPEEPGYRFEVLEGFLVKEPSPSLHHQRVSSALYRQLANYFDEFDPEGELFYAPLDLTLADDIVLQPDILLEPGALCGAEVVFTKEPVWPNSVVAQKASKVLFVSRQKILGQCYKVCLRHRLIIENMLRIVSEKAMLLNKKVEYLTIKSMRGRIAAFLLDHYRKTGRTIFTLPLNRNEMAEFLNVSRPSMSREMGRMKEEGIIDFHLSTILIKDLDALKKVAG